MPWHFAEQLACMRWARPEPTFCTRVHRVAASHYRRPALVLALPHSQPTRPDSSLAAEPLLELHSAVVRSAVAASGRPPHPLPWTAPPEPHACASCPLEQSELIHKLVCKRSSPPHPPAATERRFAVELIHGSRGADPGHL